MITLTAFGPPNVSAEGLPEASKLVHEPVRFAVLIFLVCSRNGFRTRQAILALLWPDRERLRALNALRQALHRIRTLVGRSAVVTHGNGDVSVDRAQIIADVTAFAGDCLAGRCREALELYRGDFLEGFSIPGRKEFDDWVQSRRTEFRAMARRNAMKLADCAERAGDLAGAAELWHQAHALSDYDETVLRRRMWCLARRGNPGLALLAFEKARARLEADLDVPVASETLRLAQAIRTGRLEGMRRADGGASLGEGALRSAVLAPPH